MQRPLMIDRGCTGDQLAGVVVLSAKIFNI